MAKNKDKKNKKEKGQGKGKGGKELEIAKDDQIHDNEGKIDKSRKGRKSVTFADAYPFDPAYRDECVADALKAIFEGLEQHIADKQYYPRYVARAVSRTVAQMVQMVCYSHIYWMDTWKIEHKGGANEEWDIGEELQLPPIDTWARAVIPMKKSYVPLQFLKPLISCDGQFKQFPNAELDKEQSIPRNPVRQRASNTNVLARKMGMMKKCEHCSTFDMVERKRRKTDNPEEIEKLRAKMLVRVRKRLSGMFPDQKMLNRILKVKGIPRAGLEDLLLHHQHSHFETY